jgi:hypothetical protein
MEDVSLLRPRSAWPQDRPGFRPTAGHRFVPSTQNGQPVPAGGTSVGTTSPRSPTSDEAVLDRVTPSSRPRAPVSSHPRGAPRWRSRPPDGAGRSWMPASRWSNTRACPSGPGADQRRTGIGAQQSRSTTRGLAEVRRAEAGRDSPRHRSRGQLLGGVTCRKGCKLTSRRPHARARNARNQGAGADADRAEQRVTKSNRIPRCTHVTCHRPRYGPLTGSRRVRAPRDRAHRGRTAPRRARSAHHAPIP